MKRLAQTIGALALVALGYGSGCSHSPSNIPGPPSRNDSSGRSMGGSAPDAQAEDAALDDAAFAAGGSSSADASSSVDASDCGVDASARPLHDFSGAVMDALPPPSADPICSPMVSYVQTSVMFELGPEGTMLGAVSLDGLTVVWVTPGTNTPGGAQPPSVWVADRALTTEAFGSAQQVDLGNFAIATRKVALSPDRLRIVAVQADFQSFLELRRPDTTSVFGQPSEGDFTDINSSARGTGYAVGNPTIGPDDLTFAYTLGQVVQQSKRTANTSWPPGTSLAIDYSQSSNHKLTPSAYSKDLLTLFLLDADNSVEFAAWRNSLTDPFERIARIGEFLSAQPNASCGTLFYASTGSDGSVSLAQVTAVYNP